MSAIDLILALVFATVYTEASSDSSCPQGAGTNWKVFNGSCYSLSTSQLSWEDSRNKCLNVSSETDLASIHDLVESAWIKQLTGNKDVWIGLNDIAHEGQFVWANGDTVDFLYWAPHEPDNEFFNQDCTRVMKDLDTGEWDDEKCSEEKHFVCKAPLVV